MIFKKTFHSLYFELLIAVAISLGISFLSYILLSIVNNKIYFSDWTKNTYAPQELLKNVEDLQQYINENNISSENADSFIDWSHAHDLTYFYITRDDYLVFDSALNSLIEYLDEYEDVLTDQEIENSYDDYYYNTSNYKEFDITLSDGPASLYIWGDYAYKLYNQLYIMTLIFCALIALIILVLLVRFKIRYIKKVTDGINVLEGGNLNYPIPVKGHDEISHVAESLNSMRISLAQQIENEKKAIQANSSLVTALSHDLRTPLTTQMGYLEILKEHHYSSPEEMDKYINTALDTCHQIKEMSDRLFEYFLAFDPHPERPAEALEEYDGVTLFMQLISELSLPLEAHGFRFEIDEPSDSFMIHVNMDDMLRIFNNVFTNIDKYADENEPVRISMSNDDNYEVLSISNKIRQVPRINESSKIGLISISSLMKRQGGASKTYTSEDSFTIDLKFPISSNHHQHL